MTVFLRNLQRRVFFNENTLIRDTTYLMQSLRVEKFDVSVICSGRRLIKSLNFRYRGRNVPTDVLSFPYFENLNPGVIPRPLVEDDFNLGDIVLGMEVIEQDSKQDKVDIQQYLAVMIAHGLCHLLGYSHDTQENLLLMNQKESSILKGLNDITGYTTAPMTSSVDLNKLGSDIERIVDKQHQSLSPDYSSSS